MKKFGLKFLFALLPAFLTCFMIFIFGPVEIFISNNSQFEFLFGEFVPGMTVIGIAVALIVALAVSFLPQRAYNVALGVISAIAVGGYIQIMFLNKKLDLMGLNPNGVSFSVMQILINLLVWCIVIGVFAFLAIKKSDIIKKVIAFVSILLLGMQITAMVTLIAGADESAFKREEGSWFLSGKDQMTISKNDNIIVIVLDFFSNQYVEPVEAKYPGTFDCLHDFTYYSNDECVYFGTYPSLAHMITGREVDTTLSVNDWTRSIWEDAQTKAFFDIIDDKGYVFNLYTPESVYVRGNNDIRILEGMIDNLSNKSNDLTVDKPAIRRVMTRMSCYRFMPDILKNAFYIQNSEFSGTVYDSNYGRAHTNSDFYAALKEQGLHLEDTPSTISFQHLSGAHEYNNDEFCNPKEKSTMEETCKGCMVLVEEYLDQLRALGKYDDSTIIITSDHGGEEDPQVIFFYKKPGETHDVSPVSNAPVSHCEFQPTLIKAMGADHTPFGMSIDEVGENDVRERICYVKKMNYDYPYVQCYTGDKEGSQNVYNVYLYTGDYDDLQKKMQEGPDVIAPMVDSFW